MALSIPPEIPSFDIDTLDALHPEMLRVNMQNALRALASRQDTYSAQPVNVLLELASITGTQITQMHVLPLEGAWKGELQAIAPTIFRNDFDMAKLSDPKFLQKAVRMYLLEIQIPVYEAITSPKPEIFHEARVLIIVIGNEPKEGKMIVDTRIYPAIRPRNAEEDMRYQVTHVSQGNELPESFEALMSNMVYALGRTIKAELGVLSAKQR